MAGVAAVVPQPEQTLIGAGDDVARLTAQRGRKRKHSAGICDAVAVSHSAADAARTHKKAALPRRAAAKRVQEGLPGKRGRPMYHGARAARKTDIEAAQAKGAAEQRKRPRAVRRALREARGDNAMSTKPHQRPQRAAKLDQRQQLHPSKARMVFGNPVHHRAATGTRAAGKLAEPSPPRTVAASHSSGICAQSLAGEVLSKSGTAAAPTLVSPPACPNGAVADMEKAAVVGNPTLHKCPRLSTLELEQAYKLKWGGQEKRLGAGRFGTVSLVMRQGHRELFAYKTFKPNGCAATQRSEEHCADVLFKHPHRNILAAVAAVVQSNGCGLAGIVTPLCDETLEDRWRRQAGVFSLRMVRVLVRDCFRGLSHIHSLGIIHRDLKPDNMLLSYSDSGMTLMLADWGWAHGSKAVTGQATTPGVVSEPYRPPEVWAGRTYTFSMDVWVGGVVALELLTGVRWRECYKEQASLCQQSIWMSSCPDPGSAAAALPALARHLLVPRPAAWATYQRTPPLNNVAKDFTSRTTSLLAKKRITAAQARLHAFLRLTRSRATTKMMAWTAMRPPVIAAAAASRGGANPAHDSGIAIEPPAVPTAVVASHGGAPTVDGDNGPAAVCPPAAACRPDAGRCNIVTRHGSDAEVCRCTGACAVRGAHFWSRAAADGETRRGSCKLQAMPGFSYCKVCKCPVLGCPSPRKKGTHCSGHKILSLPALHGLVAKFADVLHVPRDSECFMKHVPIASPAVAILAAQLWEPVAVEAFVGSMPSKRPSAATLLQGLHAAVRASAKEPHTNAHARCVVRRLPQALPLPLLRVLLWCCFAHRQACTPVHAIHASSTLRIVLCL